MGRVLYYHHYCPSYIFSCMITGVIISWACEYASKWAKETYRDYILLGLLMVPITVILVSYVLFFPLATYIKGQLFENNTHLNPLLDKFYVGQMWPEFGYRKAEFETVTQTHVDRWQDGHLEHPEINATLYYITPLKNVKGHFTSIVPWPASNFSNWTPGDGSDQDIPYPSWWRDEYFKKEE
ncbi:hypothetical protein SK128_016081 [Halocaridina rubra]|uniref:Protein O-mannosyl-transferase C-terminal four TM domain-containing protein n=1 Tax=Halocaridina rubra TaxID=373956 RepID=A0AAN9FWV3_HALRR